MSEKYFHKEPGGIRDYEITIEDEAKLKEMVGRVNEITRAIKEKNWQQLIEWQRGGKYEKYYDYAHDDLEKIFESLSEEEIVLQAVALVIFREQAQWGSFARTAIKYLAGGNHDLNDLLDKEALPTCIDSAVITDALTKSLGIEGEVKKTGNRFSHRYWQGKSGAIVDVWWAYKEGGLVRSQAKFDELNKSQGGSGHSCVQISGSK